MNTEQTAQQLELAAQIIRTGHPWEREFSNGEWGKTDSSPVAMIYWGGKIRPILATPPDGRPLHNPDNLTAEQVGVGYRLALKGEKVECESTAFWYREGNEWLKTAVTAHATGEACFRLPISVPWPEPQPDPYAELKKAHAEGKVIQECIRGHWIDCPHPTWKYPVNTYREKPEVPDVCVVQQIIKNTPFQLPPPPPGMQWHRTDGWKESDLPQGTRPLVLDEISPPTDEIKRHYGWTTLNSPGDCPELPAKENTAHCRTRRPLTFTHAGKTWTWHRPGDPMPCDGGRRIHIICREGRTEDKTGCRYVDRLARNNLWEKTLGWRYADEKKTVPLRPEDVLPGSVIRHSKWIKGEWMSVIGNGERTIMCWINGNMICNSYEGFRVEDYQINRSIPLTGKWNPDAWEPCSKQIDA